MAVRFDDGAEVAAPPSGLQLGVGQSGPVSLRLFRLGGTRAVLAGRVLPAQLLAVRAAAAGTTVQVATSRPQLWAPLLPRDGGHSVAAAEARTPPGGPTLVIDDRPAEARGPAEMRPWQCRLDIRTQWTPAMLATFAHADVTIFGAVPAEFVGTVARAYAITPDAALPLARLDAGSFGVLRRGRIEYVSLDPSGAEGRLLEAARASGAPPVAPSLPSSQSFQSFQGAPGTLPSGR
ncbi:hypothetical protein [Jatrophihabitans endophyticus]|uniref:hypothetical protein n=1 Tax=Jatrophihabitans endophyticus TaxID=1206085 RepID=UPI0019F99057|nr:hypothetical protein [Jatrophihabitans endophyticus]MBE7186698.1 hypothetical protein [Jatrophihabitans endophyticus]